MATPNVTGKGLRLMQENVEALMHLSVPPDAAKSTMRVTRSARRAEEARLKQQQQIEKQALIQRDNTFLKLPPEVRNIVYCFVLQDAPKEVVIDNGAKPHPFSVTCRQIRDEFLRLLRGYQMYDMDIHGHGGCDGTSSAMEWLNITRESHAWITSALVWLVDGTKLGFIAVLTLSPDRRTFKMTAEVDCSPRKRLKIQRFLNGRRRKATRTYFDGTDIVALAEVLTGRDFIVLPPRIHWLTLGIDGEVQYENGPAVYDLNQESWSELLGIPYE